MVLNSHSTSYACIKQGKTYPIGTSDIALSRWIHACSSLQRQSSSMGSPSEMCVDSGCTLMPIWHDFLSHHVSVSLIASCPVLLNHVNLLLWARAWLFLSHHVNLSLRAPYLFFSCHVNLSLSRPWLFLFCLATSETLGCHEGDHYPSFQSSS